MENASIDFLFDRSMVILERSIEVLVAVAVVVFFAGIIQYVIAQGDEKKLADGRRYMMYGIVGLSVMIGMWGFVNLLIVTIFGSNTDSDPFSLKIPQIESN
jgi:hypothetical protein